MGDMMTKIIITIAVEYCFVRMGVKVGSHVGDDIIVLSQDKDFLARFKTELENLDFKVSEDDTFISDILMFYCEEGSKIPQNIRETVSFQMKSGKPLGYIDYPRIRLLVPVKQENEPYSMTDIGRHSLLGKETRWVESINQPMAPAYRRAIILQHLLVPRDRTTYCPFTPLIIGGDESYYYDPDFVSEVIERKSIDSMETRYRISQLMHGTWAWRVIRATRTNEVLHKYHLLTPKVEYLKEIIPSDMVVTADTEWRRTLLQSFRYLEEPPQVLGRIMKQAYYHYLFKGKIIEFTFAGDRNFDHPRTDVKINTKSFLETWRNPGFQVRDQYAFKLKPNALDLGDPRSLGIKFQHYQSDKKLWQDWMNNHLDIFDRNLEDVLEYLYSGTELPYSVVQRLNIWFESDSYIKENFVRREDIPRDIILVSGDRKLGLELLRLAEHKDASNYRTHRVFMVPPRYHWAGRMGEIESLIPEGGIPLQSPLTIEDPGAIYFSRIRDMWEFVTERDGVMYDVRFDTTLSLVKSRANPRLYETRITGWVLPPEGSFPDDGKPLFTLGEEG